MTISETRSGFDLPPKPELPDHFTSDTLTTYVDFWEQVKEICDWYIGQALVQAKEDLGHGNFTKWWKARGWNHMQVANLMNWYRDPDISPLEKFEIEKVTSRRARREIVKAPVRTKEELYEHQKIAQARYQLDMLRTDMAFEAGEIDAESPDDFTIYL